MATLSEQWISGAGPGFNVPGVSPTEARRNRITSFQERAQRFPGVMGNGDTGVQDERGYTDMLGARRQYEDDLNAEEGKGPMTVRSAPLVERNVDGGDAPMRGLQMAMHGANYAGGGDEGDDNGAGRTARLANALKQRDLEDELMNPSSARPKLGTNLSDDELHAASANDFLTKAHAKTAGETYYMPEVAGPREDELAHKLEAIRQQYIEPARIKGEADLGAAELGLEGNETRADATRAQAAATFGSAQARERGTNVDALSRLYTGRMGSQYGAPDATESKALSTLYNLILQMSGKGGGK